MWCKTFKFTGCLAALGAIVMVAACGDENRQSAPLPVFAPATPPAPVSSGGPAGPPAAAQPMPGLGMMMPPTGPPEPGPGAPQEPNPNAGDAGPMTPGSTDTRDAAMPMDSTPSGDAGGPMDPFDPTSVCAGGTPGMDSDEATTRPLPGAGGRNLALVTYHVRPPNRILSFKTTLVVPEPPAQRRTLFIWPGLQPGGGSDPERLGNGVLQPVLTWGPSCSPRAPASSLSYASWWISAMYVNISTRAAGPTGCAGGDAMDTPVGDRLFIDMTVDGNEWTQTVTNLASMEEVDFVFDLQGQDQNLAIWDIEVPSSSRPAEDTLFEKSVLTFAEPVSSCQPTNAAEVDYFSAPVRSPDGLHCCYDQIILKQMRN